MTTNKKSIIIGGVIGATIAIFISFIIIVSLILPFYNTQEKIIYEKIH